jgi:hypothetical protein
MATSWPSSCSIMVWALVRLGCSSSGSWTKTISAKNDPVPEKIDVLVAVCRALAANSSEEASTHLREGYVPLMTGNHAL